MHFMKKRYFDEGYEEGENEFSDWESIKSQNREDWKGDWHERLRQSRKRTLIKVAILIIATILLCYFL